ncbi:hypothetical protein [Lactococcus lactis]|uniref:hypothetical protein n=1 Tax=Lactococcus lactis TaxID=1358 RepID=UPI00285E5352|nr:hypothetical protein [Lactococcus lactis]MDR7696125.1 hypothetical protein [Lactococcus lactis]
MKGAAMSELENIARHIVRQEEERQVEKIKLESEIKALEEVLEHGISTEFVEDEVIYIYSPKTAHDMREKLEENYKQLHAKLTIPKSIADELEEEIEEAYSNDYIRSYSDVGAYMEVITDGLDEDSELYKFMFPDNDALLGCSHRNIIYLYLVDNDLVKVVEG